jgi:hypothetical protein
MSEALAAVDDGRMMMKRILEIKLVFRTCVLFGHSDISYISLDTLCSMGSEEILDSYYVL